MRHAHDRAILTGTQVPHFLEFLTYTELLLCCGIVLVASILQISVGMGFGMLASPLIALIKPEIVPGTILIMGLVVAFSGTWSERHHMSITELKLGIGGRVIGSVMALGLLLLIPDVNVFMILFGIVSLSAVLLTASGWQLVFNNKNLLNLSVVSGVMGTITAVGAPPMAIIYHDKPPEVVRPTLNAFFGAGAVLGLASLQVSGWLSIDDLIAAIVLLPAMFLGILIAEPFKKIPSFWLSRILLLLSGAASFLLIVRGALYWI
ncbi:MAG: sulfite exporter TauE/SafE family protein [Pseudomonadota bacterium]